MSADLHCHTRLSDGTLGIDDIITLAKNSGVETLAITDHDSLAGTMRAEVIGRRFGVKVIPGVEFTSTDSKRSTKAHLLCYLPENPTRLEGLCRSNTMIRKKASHIMLLKVAQKYPISADYVMRLAGTGCVFKQHIMQALLDSGYTTTIFGELFDSLFKKDSPDSVLVSFSFPEPAEVLSLIHEAGGIAVLAHPGFYNNFELLDELIPLGLDGVEVWHPENTPEQRERLISVARENNLLMTGGSDFHGGYNAYPIRIGDCVAPDDCVEALLGYQAKMRRRQRKDAKAEIAAKDATGVSAE